MGHHKFCTQTKAVILKAPYLLKSWDAFGVHKLRTTPYHPQRDGMVERFNWTLLQLLRAYVTSQHDWETYLSYIL